MTDGKNMKLATYCLVGSAVGAGLLLLAVNDGLIMGFKKSMQMFLMIQVLFGFGGYFLGVRLAGANAAERNDFRRSPTVKVVLIVVMAAAALLAMSTATPGM